MGFISRFENKAENIVEGGGRRGKGGIEPVKICKRAAKEMQREKLVGAGAEYAPTLYTVLLGPADDAAMNGYYPTLAGEVETYLKGAAGRANLTFECAPLVRFMVDDALKPGRFDIIAENVTEAIIAQLRHEEHVFYGMSEVVDPAAAAVAPAPGSPFDPFAPSDLQAAPYVPVAPAAVPPVPPAPVREVPIAAETELLNLNALHAPAAFLIESETMRQFELSGATQIIGREPSACQVVLQNPGVSRQHARITHDGNAWILTDLGSTNGTCIDGRRIHESYIYAGDTLTFGNASFVFQEGAAAADPLEPSNG